MIINLILSQCQQWKYRDSPPPPAPRPGHLILSGFDFPSMEEDLAFAYLFMFLEFLKNISGKFNK